MRLRFLRGTVSHRVLAAVALGAAAQSALAQEGPRELPALSVEGRQPSGGAEYKVDDPSLPKLTEPLRNTPQSIDVVPKQMMEDRGATTMNEAIRTVPGVSIAAGEAGSQGSNLTLRGFSARNDIFLDGMRDFGSYYRDSFNLDEIEVLKGPASMLFGRGSTGGVVNQVSKTPQLHGFTAGTAVFGSDMTKRVTGDIDVPIEGINGAAFRLNVMANENDVAGRDQAEYQRYGVAPSIAFGLDSPTRTTLSFFHQSEFDVPDYGLPRYFTGVPSVRPNNFYGFDTDYLRTNADVATANVEHDANDWLTVRDQIRLANYTRHFRITEPQLPGAVTPSTPLQNITVTRNILGGDGVETFLQNQTDAVANFRTGELKHTVVAGVEIGRETSDPTRYTFTGVPGTSLVNPGPNVPFVGNQSVRSNIHTSADTIGVYVADTMKIGEHWEVSGGSRYDRFDANFEDNVAGTALGRIDNLVSWRAGLVYKPVPIGSIYFGWGTSFNPSAESLSLSPSTINTPPEKNETYEIGTKWDLLAERLMVRAAIFRTDKTDARVTDPNDPTQMILGGGQRVDGFELEATGRITERLQVFAGYAYMDGETSKVPPGGTQVLGGPLQNVPMHTFHAWSTYELPYRFQVGTGVNWVSERVARNTPAPFAANTIVPGYVTWDAMLKYHLTDDVDVQLNVINMLDTFYIDQLHPNHLIPGAGRTVLLTTAFKF